MAQRQVLIAGPQGIAGDVRSDHRLLSKCRRAARTHAWANLQWSDGLSPSAWNTRAGCRPQPCAVWVHQKNGRNRVRSLSINSAAQVLQDIGEARTTGNHFQRFLFRGQKRFRPLQIFYIGIRSIPSDDLALFISDRHSAKQKPAIFSIEASQACLFLPWLSRGKEA